MASLPAARSQAVLLIIAFGMIAYLKMAPDTQTKEKPNLIMLLLSATTVTGGAIGLLTLLATSTQASRYPLTTHRRALDRSSPAAS